MFINPWALLLGGIAAIAPLVIHWLTKPRPQRMPLSTLRFVREAIQQRRTQHRLRDAILLALRIAAILLLGLAMSRPRANNPRVVGDVHDDATLRVVVLDTSQSMMSLIHGVQAFERARAVTAGYLRYQPNLRANLILAAARPSAVFDLPSQNFGALRDELQRSQCSYQYLDINRAITQAAPDAGTPRRIGRASSRAGICQ